MGEHPTGPRGPGLVRGLRGIGLGLLALPRSLVVVLCLAWMGMIWFLSSHSIASPGGGGGLWQLLANTAHAPLFGVIALLLCAVLVRREEDGTWRLGAREVLFVVAVVTAYGALDEWHQSMTPGRHPSAFDVLTDLVGAGCVVWIVALLGRDRVGEAALLGRLVAGVGLCFASGLLSAVVAGS